MGAEAEKAGIPAVSIVAPQFAALAVIAARGQGVADIPISILPYAVMNGQTNDVEDACGKAIDAIVSGLTTWKPKEDKRAKANEDTVSFEAEDYPTAAGAMNDHFLSRMWSDGLPLIPPTRERVDWMLTGTDLPKHHLLTDRFPPRKGRITVETLAINAAMAGARPEYMPVLLAAVEAFATDVGLTLMHYLTNSVVNQAPVLVLNGPVIRELNVNASYGLMGPGYQANATIGRAVSLLFINGAGAYFAPGGNLPCQSIPGRYSWCFAENEGESPWQPFHVERGFSPSESAVSVALGKGTHLIFLQPPVSQLLHMFAHAVEGISAREFGVPWDQMLVLCPGHAKACADAGFTKQDICEFVYEHARMPYVKGRAAGFTFRHSPVWAKRFEEMTDKAAAMIPKLEKPEDLKIVVAGGPNCASSTLIPGMYEIITRSIERYKPAAWNDLLDAARKAGGRS